MKNFLNKVSEKIDQLKMNPPLVLVIGFALLILCGGLLLNLSAVTKSGQSIGFINALFTAGSASCVTGLVVVNTANYWNLAGQIIILILIQIGGLGIMTLATMFPLILGKRIGLQSRQILKEQMNIDTFSGIVRLLKYLIKFTFIAEGIGVVLLATRFIPAFGWLKGIWYSVFQSISAFCNAGFDNLGDSILPWRHDPLVNFTIMGLVVIGGLGFIVTQELLRKRKNKTLSLHSKLVLTITGLLIFFGALFFFILESSNPETLATESIPTQIGQSFFQSVIARTAGFYSAPISGLRDASAFLLILLMFVGGSPGSTAGGLKTTTFGVLVLSTISTIKGENEPVVFNKHIGLKNIRKALALVVVGLLLVISVSFLLTVTEDVKFIDLLFETVSAYGTVGLSKGITQDLTSFGKIIIMLTMYAGRVGPLTLGFAISNRMRPSKLRYPEANVLIG
ncbi:MAG: TrkH family potassium uptake protein [Bacillota bacterium]|jgi:trk system potassium uptake protein TrkH|nr:TrkH family potassium uptake protein [Bacillota bacterium]